MDNQAQVHLQTHNIPSETLPLNNIQAHPISAHSMVTRSQMGTFKPNPKYLYIA